MNCSRTEISAEELRSLIGTKKAAVCYDGEVYDVTEFLGKHPGGRDPLLLCAGRDVTHLFNSYHPIPTRKLIAKRCKHIGSLKNPPQDSIYTLPKFPEKDKLYEELLSRISGYFRKNELDPNMHAPFLRNGAAVIIGTLLFWYMAVSFTSHGYSIFIGALFAFLSGFSCALVTMNLGHDISHFALSRKPSVWKWAGHLICCVHGISPYVWAYQHVIGHHVYPNYDTLDPDVATKKVDYWRIKSFQEWCPHYVYQHIYMPLLFTLLSLKMRVQDFHNMLTLHKADTIVNPPGRQELLLFILSKTLFLYYRIILPYPYLSLANLLLLNIVSELINGFWLGFITQVNHINGSVIFPDASSKPGMTWSEMQVATAVDYATDSPLWSFLTGGLNTQVVHHLFPWILSSYYVDINPIVEKTCAEYGVSYMSYSGIWDIWKAHIKYLKMMGQAKTS